MSTELSPSTRALLRSARADGPDTAARARLLADIATATSGAAVMGAGAKVAAGGMKLGALLFGGIVTVGLAAVAIGVSAPKSKLAPDPSFAAHAEPDVAPVAPVAIPGVVATAEPTTSPATPTIAATKRGVAHAAARATMSRDDSLAREASLVGEARGALVRGQAESALSAIRATELLPVREMEPEELSIEARALRALGRDPEADFVERQLRARFPDNALSR